MGLSNMIFLVADKERFELSEPVRIRTLSRGVVSATHPLVRKEAEIIRNFC